MTSMVERPDLLFSITIKKKTGCGKMYITITIRDGKIFEVFNQMGKAGGCAASQSEMAGRLISAALRSGVEPQVLVKQLKGISCHLPDGFGESKVLSCADAIAQAMEEVLKNLDAYTKAFQAIPPAEAMSA